MVDGPFASDGSWTININSGALTSTASLAYFSRRYWGVSSTSPLTNAEVMLPFLCLRERGDQELPSPAMVEEFCRLGPGRGEEERLIARLRPQGDGQPW